jgi:stage III sporulation protein SpoIIIAA
MDGANIQMGYNVNLSLYYKVGTIDNTISTLINFKYHGTIYAAPGVIKHIIKRHNHELSQNVLTDMVGTIESIIKSPDYVGKHPDKGEESMEYIKKIDDNLLVGLEIDLNEGYIYVATMHPISEGKISNRLNSGRIKAVPKI